MEDVSLSKDRPEFERVAVVVKESVVVVIVDASETVLNVTGKVLTDVPPSVLSVCIYKLPKSFSLEIPCTTRDVSWTSSSIESLT